MTTGTTKSQIAREQLKIEKLQEHLSFHKKDNSAKKALLKSKNQVRTLNAYAKRQENKLKNQQQQNG